MNNKIDLHKLAIEMAKYLDEFEVCEPDNADWLVELVGPYPECIYISNDSKKGRVQVKGSYAVEGVNWYNHAPYQEDMPSITCAFSRGALAIAKDVNRRLLPPYREFIDKVHKRYLAYKKSIEDKQAVMLKLSNAFGGKVYGSEDNPRVDFGRYGDNKPSGTAKHYYEGHLTLELRDLTPQTAVKVAEVLMK